MDGGWLIAALAVALVVIGLAWRRAVAERRMLLAENTRLRREGQAAQARLAETGEELTGLAEAAFDALIVVDRERRVRVMNAAARSLFGAQETQGQSFITVARQHDLDDLLAAALSALMGDDVERERMARRAPEVLDRFSADRVLAQWEALLASIVQERAHRRRIGTLVPGRTPKQSGSRG